MSLDAGEGDGVSSRRWVLVLVFFFCCFSSLSILKGEAFFAVEMDESACDINARTHMDTHTSVIHIYLSTPMHVAPPIHNMYGFRCI